MYVLDVARGPLVAVSFFSGLSLGMLAVMFTVNSPKQEPPTLIHVPAPACAPSQVVCECPAYEQGWDDAEFARGEIEEERTYDVEDLEAICAEYDEYGYVPDC